MTDAVIRHWREEDRPALRAIFAEGFGDSESEIRAFHDRFLKPGTCLVAEASGAPVSAMYILPGQTLCLSRRRSLSAGYAYALATLPAWRGRGLGAAVYKAVCETILQTAEAACVLPSEAGLYPFYEKANGAAPVSFAREARFTREELRDRPRLQAARIDVGQYAGIRESLLSGWPRAYVPMEFFDAMDEDGADFLMLENALAAAETAGDTCYVRELLAPEGDGLDALATVARWCPASEYIVRSPVFFDGPGESRPFMLGVLRPDIQASLPDDLWWPFGLE